MIRKSGVEVLKSGRIVAFTASSLIFVAALIGVLWRRRHSFFSLIASLLLSDALLYFGVTAGTPPDPLGFTFTRFVSLEPDFLVKQWAWNVAVRSRSGGGRMFLTPPLRRRSPPCLPRTSCCRWACSAWRMSHGC